MDFELAFPRGFEPLLPPWKGDVLDQLDDGNILTWFPVSFKIKILDEKQEKRL